MEIDAEALIPETANPYDDWVLFSVDLNSNDDGYLSLYINGLEVYSEEVFPDGFFETYDYVSFNDVYPYPSEGEVAVASDISGFSVPEDHYCFESYLSPVLL